jgi:hypothetical protein
MPRGLIAICLVLGCHHGTALKTRLDAGTGGGAGVDSAAAGDLGGCDASFDAAATVEAGAPIDTRADLGGGAGVDSAAAGDLGGCDASFDAAATVEAVAPIDTRAKLDGGAGTCTLFLGGPPLPELSGLQDSIEIGDLDGDGRADLAATIPGSKLLSVVFGQGGGVFGPPVDYATGNRPGRLRIADLDGDGDLDVVVVNQDDASLGVFLNQGQGTLAPRVDYATAPSPFSVVVGDVNGDGKKDLAMVTAGSASLFLNRGDGSFAARQDFAVKATLAFFGPEPAMGDVNRDGRDDLLVPGKVTSVMFGQADGTLSAPTEYPQESTHLAVGDVNGDGFLDIVRGSQHALINRGDGTFDILPASDAEDHSFIFALGDLTGDGILDLAMLWDDSEIVIVMPGRGDGTFPGEFATYYTSPDYPYSVAIGDVDGDGHNDLVLQGDNRFPTVLRYPGFGRRSYLAGEPMVRQDLNGDGLVDIAAAYAAAPDQAHVVTMLRRPDRTYQATIVYTREGTWFDGLGIGDTNGDGVADLVLRDVWWHKLVTLFGKADGTFPTSTEQALAANVDLAEHGDFNGDGLLDMLWKEGKTVSLSLAAGDGTFAPPVAIYSTGTPQSVVAYDVDRDGHLDLVITVWVPNVVSVLLGRGDGTFAPAIGYPTGLSAGLEEMPSRVAIADVNGDSFADLAVILPYQSRILVAFGTGDGSFAQWASYDSLGSATWVHFADMDGDGWPDLIAAKGYGYSVLLNQGYGTFAKSATYVSMGFNEADVYFTDDNGDGRVDVIKTVYDGTAVGVEALYNTCQ